MVATPLKARFAQPRCCAPRFLSAASASDLTHLPTPASVCVHRATLSPLWRTRINPASIACRHGRFRHAGRTIER